jgi:hypothetical protein
VLQDEQALSAAAPRESVRGFSSARRASQSQVRSDAGADPHAQRGDMERSEGARGVHAQPVPPELPI